MLGPLSPSNNSIFSNYLACIFFFLLETSRR